ncbi:hypothetical protein [Wolbachia endosymbiont (group E) of Neria commutata]|uniref:hypothetical protein n=1 Tax=Wolbachia endosymbiont (group E) of Neria commutata TaxID=3066149 RepID=UPI003132DE21
MKEGRTLTEITDKTDNTTKIKTFAVLLNRPLFSMVVKYIINIINTTRQKIEKEKQLVNILSIEVHSM